jgi:hypothetical protein
MTGSWQGEIRVQTQRGQAAALLDRLVKMVEKAQAHLGMQPLAMERTSPAIEAMETAPNGVPPGEISDAGMVRLLRLGRRQDI